MPQPKLTKSQEDLLQAIQTGLTVGSVRHSRRTLYALIDKGLLQMGGWSEHMVTLTEKGRLWPSLPSQEITP